jgi:hypothetical protein
MLNVFKLISNDFSAASRPYFFRRLSQSLGRDAAPSYLRKGMDMRYVKARSTTLETCNVS